MTDEEVRRRVIEPRGGNEVSSDAEMDSEEVVEGVDDFILTPRERSSSTSSMESMDSALSQLIPACVWKVVSFESLPSWLKDNEYLRHGYRPPMQSFKKCFHVSNAYRNLEHLDTPVWCGDVLCYSTVCLCLRYVQDKPSPLVWTADHWCFLFGCNLMFRILVSFPHGQQSFWRCCSPFLQATLASQLWSPDLVSHATITHFTVPTFQDIYTL